MEGQTTKVFQGYYKMLNFFHAQIVKAGLGFSRLDLRSLNATFVEEAEETICLSCTFLNLTEYDDS
jgi:hypothetical protein